MHETEVVVVGAGAVGCSIAYWLAKRGKAVILVDKGGPGAGTSSANFGLVWASTKEPYTYMELNLRSGLMWPQMLEELGEDVELRQDRGGLKVCLTEEQYTQHEAILDEHRQSRIYQGQMLTPREVFGLQPGVSRNIVGALWSPYDGDCNPLKWVAALFRGCQRLGVTFLRDTEVTGFDLDEGNAVTGVLTRRGRIATRYAVNAAGPWAGQLARMVGVMLDLYPERGQVLVTEPAPILCPTPMSTVRQGPSGHFYIGSTSEEVGFDLSSTPEGMAKVAGNAARIVPITADLAVIRAFSGLRSMPRDELPFLGPIPHVPRYYIAVGHSGITLSPIHGKIISDLIVEGETDLPLDDYDPLRYDQGVAV
jgi:sarcosine oxidase subunit beta